MSRLASWRVVIVSGVLLVAFAGVFFASSAPFAVPSVENTCGAPPLDVRPYSTADDVNRFLDECGDAGRNAYRDLQLADLAYPAVFGLFMASALALALEHLFPQRPALIGLAAIALAGSGFDYLENLFAWRALAAYPDPVATNSLLGLASAAKTASFWIAGLLLVASTTALIGRAVRRRHPTPADQPGDNRVAV